MQLLQFLCDYTMICLYWMQIICWSTYLQQIELTRSNQIYLVAFGKLWGIIPFAIKITHHFEVEMISFVWHLLQ